MCKGGRTVPTLTENTPVSAISGVGKTREAQLNKLGISTLGDLLYYFPRAYENRGATRTLSQCELDVPCSFVLTVATSVRSAKLPRGLTVSKFRAFDETGSVEITFFNSPFIKDVFHVGSVFRFYGRPSMRKRTLELTNPKYEPYVEGIPLPDLVPIYPETEGLSSKQIDKLMRIAVNDLLPSIVDPLPESIRLKYSLPSLSYALLNAHFPESEKTLSRALSRLAFDELLLFGLTISMSAGKRKLGGGIKFAPCSLKPVTDRLHYDLTPSQKTAVNDVYKDTVLGENGVVSPMARIIVGDVGCGKTVCALLAMYIAAKSGAQSALMVPTEILARQHYKEATELLSPLGIRIELLLGSTTAKEKRRIKEGLMDGSVDIAVGTHALISDGVDFSNLGLIITDEQHRFGVAQRAALKEKASEAHVLVMSATPIPRTLALAVYGDLDVSRITDMPTGRSRVETYVVNEAYRNRLNDFIAKQIAMGGQCYVVCPSIESPDDSGDEMLLDRDGFVAARDLNLKNATDYKEELSRALPNARIALLHGKMKAAEKDAVMTEFASGNVDVLVSTTVIEVGVNVPNASLMIVENAERFGLSQLHQLRGRVGRGTRKSYCVLVSDKRGENAEARLETMRTVYDGYQIAEKDLALRGPGEFFSSNSDNNLRQSGGFSFKFASLTNDSESFTNAFSVAKSIVQADPLLELEEHALLAEKLKKMISSSGATIS